MVFHREGAAHEDRRGRDATREQDRILEHDYRSIRREGEVTIMVDMILKIVIFVLLTSTILDVFAALLAVPK